jgi:hypothetical protein
VCLLAAAVAYGCEDAPGDPLTGLVAEESHAALALDVSLVDPRTWAEGVGPDPALDRALWAWRDSWNLLPERGRQVREGLYPTLARALATEMTWGDVERELVLVEEALARATLLDEEALPDHLVVGLTGARSSRAWARAALADGDLVQALTHLMRAGDALRTVGPEAVARSLVAEAQSLLRRVSEGDPYTQEDRERLERLERGARQALESEDWVLAIRRAYYARGILLGAR